MFTTFSPSYCHAMSPSRGFLTSTVLREEQETVTFSKAYRLTIGRTQPPGALSHWDGAEADHSPLSRAKVSTSMGMHMDSFTLRLCMSHTVNMYNFPHTLYNYIIFFEKQHTCFSFVC